MSSTVVSVGCDFDPTTVETVNCKKTGCFAFASSLPPLLIAFFFFFFSSFFSSFFFCFIALFSALEQTHCTLVASDSDDELMLNVLICHLTY